MQYVTPAQAAITLSVSVREVYRLLKAGMIPATRDGRRWWIDRDDLLRHKTVDPQATEDEHTSSTSLAGKYLPGEEDFIAWITTKKQQ